jgi:hypothetical protein
MVDRITHIQNALHQIQEKNKGVAVDIPPDTCERHEKNVRRRHRHVFLCCSARNFLAQVRQPVASRPTDEQFWMNDHHGRRKPNSEFLREHFLHEGRLTEEQALAILRQCTDMLAAAPNVLKVKSPVTGVLLVKSSCVY